MKNDLSLEENLPGYFYALCYTNAILNDGHRPRRKNMRNEINANIYTTDLTNIEKSNDAWRMGRELFYTTLNNQFALLDKEILFKFLKRVRFSKQ